MINTDNTQHKIYNICAVFLMIAIFTSSFDEILLIRIGASALRVSQLCIAVSSVCMMLVVFYSRKMLLPVGWKELLTLLIINAMFCFNAQSKMRSFGYEIWFLLNIALVVITVNLFDTEKAKLWIVKMWALSGVALALFGVVQFLFGVFGLSLFVEQWTKPFLPRLNGLCSEPSYYACFLIPFFVFFAYMVENKDEGIFKQRTNLIFYGLLGTVMVFSTSRMGLLMVGLWLAFRLAVSTVQRKWDAIKRIAVLVAIVVIAFLSITQITALENPIYNNGKTDSGHTNSDQTSHGQTGGGQTSSGQTSSGQTEMDYIKRYSDFSGSGVERIFGMLSALEVFRESPLIGYSLGGVLEKCEQYAQKVDLLHPLLNKRATALFVSNVTAELFAAWGVVGVLLLASYFYRLWRQCYNKNIPKDLFYHLRFGILWGIVWQFGMLQFNNNFMRIYVWCTIAVFSALCSGTTVKFNKKKLEKESECALR